MFIPLPILLIFFFAYVLCDEDKYKNEFPEEYCGDVGIYYD